MENYGQPKNSQELVKFKEKLKSLVSRSTTQEQKLSKFKKLLIRIKKHPLKMLNLFRQLIQRCKLFSFIDLDLNLELDKAIYNVCNCLIACLKPIETKVEGYSTVIKKEVIKFYSYEELFVFQKRILIDGAQFNASFKIQNKLLDVVFTIEKALNWENSENLLNFTTEMLKDKTAEGRILRLKIISRLKPEIIQKQRLNVLELILNWIDNNQNPQFIVEIIDILRTFLSSQPQVENEEVEKQYCQIFQKVIEVCLNTQNEKYILLIFEKLKRLIQVKPQPFTKLIIEQYNLNNQIFDTSIEGICLLCEAGSIISANNPQISTQNQLVEKAIRRIFQKEELKIFQLLNQNFELLFQDVYIQKFLPEFYSFLTTRDKTFKHQISQDCIHNLVNIQNNQNSQLEFYFRSQIIIILFSSDNQILEELANLILNQIQKSNNSSDLIRFSIYNLIIRFRIAWTEHQLWNQIYQQIVSLNSTDTFLPNKFCLGIISISLCKINISEINKVSCFHEAEQLLQNFNFSNQAFLSYSLLDALAKMFPRYFLEDIPQFIISSILSFVLKIIRLASDELKNDLTKLSFDILLGVAEVTTSLKDLQKLNNFLIEFYQRNKEQCLGASNSEISFWIHTKFRYLYIMNQDIHDFIETLLLLLESLLSKTKVQLKILLNKSLTELINNCKQLPQQTTTEELGLENIAFMLMMKVIRFRDKKQESPLLRKMICFIILMILEQDQVFKLDKFSCHLIDQTPDKTSTYFKEMIENSFPGERYWYFKVLKQALSSRQEHMQSIFVLTTCLNTLYVDDQRLKCLKAVEKSNPTKFKNLRNTELESLLLLLLKIQNSIEKIFIEEKNKKSRGERSVHLLNTKFQNFQMSNEYKLIEQGIYTAESIGTIIDLFAAFDKKKYQDLILKVALQIAPKFKYFSYSDDIADIPKNAILLTQFHSLILNQRAQFGQFWSSQYFKRCLEFCDHPTIYIRQKSMYCFKKYVTNGTDVDKQMFIENYLKGCQILEKYMNNKFNRHWIDTIYDFETPIARDTYYYFNQLVNQSENKKIIHQSKLDCERILTRDDQLLDIAFQQNPIGFLKAQIKDFEEQDKMQEKTFEDLKKLYEYETKTWLANKGAREFTENIIGVDPDKIFDSKENFYEYKKKFLEKYLEYEKVRQKMKKEK